MKLQNKIMNILSIFLMVQPFFDIYYLYHMENIDSIFVFSPSTILRLLVFAVLFILFILDKKKFKTTFAFAAVCLGYFVVHHYVAGHSLFYKNETYSIVSELFYILRVAIPLYMIYLVYHYKFEDRKIEKIFYTVAFIFSSIMIVTNLFYIALPAYPYGDTIKGNFFTWFLARNMDITAYELATKGIFNMANQIAGVFVIIFPMLVYYLYTNYSRKKLIVVIMMIISMYMLGTRVSSWGVILVLVVMLLVYLITNFKKWEKNLIILNILLVIFSSILIYFAPVSIRQFYEGDDLLTGTSEEKAAQKEKLYKKLYNYLENYETVNKKTFDRFIEKNGGILYIPVAFFEVYPIEEDPEFWLNHIKTRTGVDNRYVENALITYFDGKYGNKKTMLFGHSYTKTFNNGFYLERDFLYQYYALGVVGLVIFFAPYILIEIYAAYVVLRYRDKFNMKNLTYMFAIALLMASSLMSGNIMDTFIDTIFLAFICGLLLNSLKKEKNMLEVFSKKNKKKKNKKVKVSVVVPVYNVEDYIERCLLSIVNQTLDEMEVIVVNDGSKDGSLEKIKDICALYPDKIKLIDKVNEGVSIARNTGIKEATGEYIGFVDSDDWVEPTMYEKLYNKAKAEDLDVVACDASAVYPDRRVTINSNLSVSPDNKELFINAYAVIWNKIYKRELIQDIKFKPNVWYEDVLYLYMLYPGIKTLGKIDEPLYNYLQREGSITYTYNEKLYQLIENMDDMVKYYNENNYMEMYKDEVEYSYVRYLYATFIKRLAKSKDKKEFNRGVEYVIKKVNETFPEYRKNKYIKSLSPKNLYLKYFNKPIAKIIFALEKNKQN